MILCKGDPGLVQAVHLEARIDVPGEGVEGGALRLSLEAAEAAGVELGKLVGNVHQLAQAALRELRRPGGQDRCLRLEDRTACREGRQRPCIIERLGGREDGEHGDRLGRQEPAVKLSAK